LTQDKSLNNLELSTQKDSFNPTESHHSQVSSLIDEQKVSKNSRLVSSKPFWFSVAFVGYMDMYSDVETVAQYLNAHEGWFCRCAQPMRVEPLNKNGYILNVGRFASLGYEVEPKIAVVLDPPQDNLYVMRTVPIPNYEAPGYEVQYKSMMELEEISAEEIVEQSLKKLFAKKLALPSTITRVSWQLSLTVTVEFPKFIEKFPVTLIQKTGERLLAQIVRQISPRLTYKVQQDFHLAKGLPLPAKSGRGFSEMAQECSCVICPNSDDSSIKTDYHTSRDNNYAA
jgi:hypothetical protein